MVQIGYNSTAPNPQQLLAQNNSAPVVPETMQSTEPMMSVDPSMVKPDPVVAKKPTNQFDYAANIGAIPGVNTYSPAENPIFKTQIFKDSIAKQRAIPDAIKDFTSGMPKEEFANYYKEFKAEDAEWISKLSEDLKLGIPYSKIREFYPEIDEYGLKNLEKTIKSDEYLSDLRLDGETQLLSNEMKGLDPTIDYLGPIFEGNSKENFSEYGFGGIVIEGTKLVGNLVTTAPINAVLFGINAVTDPVNTVKMLGKLPKAAKLGFQQAWDDTEGMSDAERVQTMVSLGMDFITENPDIIFEPEAIFAKGGLASKGASLARRVVSNVGERGQKFINAAGNVQDTLKWEDKVIQGAKQGFEAAFEKEKKAPSNVSQETKDLLYTALPPRAKNLKYMTAVEYKESIPEALKSLFTNRDNLQVMPDPDTGAIKGLFQGDKIAKMNDTELVKNIVGAADTTLKDTWDIILEVGDQAAADGILGNTKDIVANIDNVLDNMQIGNTKILNTDTKTIRMLGEFRNQLLQNGGNIDIKTLQSLSQRLNKFWKEGDPMMIAAAEEINKLLRPLITDVGMQVLDNLNLSSIKKQWGGLRNLTDNFEALSKYAEKYPSPNVFQKANDLWSKIQAVKGAARILSGDPSGALDLGAAVMQNMGGAQLKGFDRIKGFAKGFRNMADHVGDTKIPGGYGRGYVKNLIKARINNTPKLGYTPEATPMITPEGTIKQTIVTTPEAKGGAMQTDITKPGAIKEPGKNQYSEFLVGYAPFREGNISDVTTIDLAKQSKQYNDWIMKANNFAKTLGLDISTDNKTIGVRGKTSDSRELSRFTIVKGDKNDIKTFAAMMGATAPDIQNAVMMGEYTKGVKANGVELSFTINGDVNAVIDSLQEQGIQNLTYIPETKQVVLIDTDNTFTEAQTDFIHSLYKNGDTADLRKQGVNTNFIGEDEYVGILGEALNTNRGQQNMTNVRDALEFAEAKARRGGGGYSKKLAEKRKASLDKVKSYISTNKEKLGLSDYTETHVASLDENISKKISKAFDKAIDYNDPNATPAYKADVKKAYTSLANETSKQYDFLTKKLGLKIEFIKDDPYKTSDDMFEDILENNRLKIYQGGEPNEFMSQVDKSGLSINEKFRAIHDFFGHFIEGNHFGKLGEEKAWVSHSKMFSPEARKALTTETRGQNSWVNFSGKNKNALKKFAEARDLIEQGKISEGLQLQKEGQSEFIYADQKTSILPDKYVDYTHYNKIEEAKGGYMQTDITKPGAIKTLPDNPTDGTITNEGTAAGEVGQAESAMKEVSGTQSSPTKSNGPGGGDSGKGNEIGQYLDSGLYDTYEDFDILGNIPREDILTLREVNPNITDVEIVKMYEEGKKAMDNAMKNEFTELDMNYAKEIRKLNEEEQRIGTIAGKEINAEATAKQVSDREANRNLVRERMQADYGLDEEAILQKMDELDGKDINEPYKQKSKYIPAEERKARREERLQKTLDKARRPVGETIKIPEIGLHGTNYKGEIEKGGFKLGNEIKKGEERGYIYMSPSPEGYQASRAGTVQVNLKGGNFDIVDIKDLPIIGDNQIESYGVKKGYDGTVIVRDGKIQEILTTKDYANKNIIKELSSDVSATKGMAKSKTTLQDIIERMKNATPEEIDANLKELRTFREQLVKNGDSSSKELIKEVDDDIAYITELKKSPKDLQPLYEEARKYKSAEEFISNLEKNKKITYHGTNTEFDEFDIGKAGTSTKSESAKKAIFFTDDADIARGYGEYANDREINDMLAQVEQLQKIGKWDEASVLEARAEKIASGPYKKPVIKKAVIDTDNISYFDAEGKGFLETDKKINDLIDKAKKEGKDVLVVKNLIDNVYADSTKSSTHTIVLNPKVIKTESQLKQIREKSRRNDLPTN